ncbi:hypothetical protein EFK68_04450 [Pseudomonas aeruginosa]|nr:hypothetical protein EFK68_04450 [Pseudomonas aeruginosa]
MRDPIVVSHQTIGVDQYFATAEQAETILVGLRNYGFLLKCHEMQSRRYTFAAFADCIESSCDSGSPQTVEVVRTLREVHQLQQDRANLQ